MIFPWGTQDLKAGWIAPFRIQMDFVRLHVKIFAILESGNILAQRGDKCSAVSDKLWCTMKFVKRSSAIMTCSFNEFELDELLIIASNFRVLFAAFSKDKWTRPAHYMKRSSCKGHNGMRVDFLQNALLDALLTIHLCMGIYKQQRLSIFFRIFLLLFSNGWNSHIGNFTQRRHLETKKTLE